MYPPKQKPNLSQFDLDTDGKPVGGTPSQQDLSQFDLDDYGNPYTPEKSFGSQVWESINEPWWTGPSRLGKYLSQKIDPQQGGSGLRSVMSAYAESLGDTLSGMTSTLNLGTMGAFGVGNLAARTGASYLPKAVAPTMEAIAQVAPKAAQVARGGTTAGKILSAPVAAHGVERLTSPDATFAERVSGGVEAIGGGFGMAAKPSVRGPITSRLPDRWFGGEPPTPEATVADLLPKLRESLDRDAARASQKGKNPQTTTDPTGSPNAQTRDETIKLQIPYDPAQIKQLKRDGYDFVGIDAKSGEMTLTKKVPIDPNFNQGQGDPMQAGSTPYGPPTRGFAEQVLPDDGQPNLPFHRPEEFTPVGPMPRVQPGLPDIDLPTGQMDRGFPVSEGEVFAPPGPPRGPSGGVRFAFMDPHNFPEGPQPFYHLEDGSTVSGIELERRGIEPPPIPDEQLGIGRQFPGIEAQELGPINQPIDLNQALADMELDMAKPVGRGSTQGFDQQVLGERPLLTEGQPIMDPGLAERNLLHQRQAQAEGPVMPMGETPMRPQIEPPQLPHEFGPDIRQTTEFYPETGGESPRFEPSSMGRQIPDFEGKFSDEMRTNQNPRWIEAEHDANILGIDPRQFDNIDDLEWAITQETAHQTMQTGINPLARGEDVMNMGEAFPEGDEILGASRMADIEGGKIRMDIGDREEMIRIFKQTYKGSVPQVATKELLQNAIDAAKLNKSGQGRAIVGLDEPNRKITVMDNGLGLTREEIGTVYTNLSSSGKRGKGKNVGELGVGKTTYLVTGDSVKVTSVAREPDGRLYQHEFEGTPEQIIEGVMPRSSVVPEGTPTGTSVELTVGKNEKFNDLRSYLNHFENYSNSPVPVEIQDAGGKNVQIPANQTVPGKPFANGTIAGTDYKLSVPDSAQWAERDRIALVLSNRGMMQGVDSIWTGRGVLPDRVLVELDPTVIGTHDDYPLTAPTRESLKDTTKHEIHQEITKHLVMAARKAQEQRLQQAFDELKPQFGNRHVIHDSGGRYSQRELKNLGTSQELHHMARVMDEILGTLKNMFPDLDFETTKSGWLIDAPEAGGINIPNPSTARNRWSTPRKPSETAILVNPFSAMIHSANPEEFADRLVHIITHEFAHNIARNEGASYTWALAKVLTKFGARLQGSFANDILKYATEPGASGGYATRLQELLSEYHASRGRTEVVKDLLSDARKSEFIREPGGPAGTPTSFGDDVSRATGETPGTVTLRQQHASPERVKSLKDRGYEFSDIDEDGTLIFTKTGQGQPPGGPPILESEVPPPPKRGKPEVDPNKINWAREVFELPRAMMSVDPPFMTSAMFRQGLPLIGTKGWFQAAIKQARAFGSQQYFDMRMKQLEQDPLFRPQGKKGVSWAERIGVEMTDMGSKLTKREEALRSKIAEKIPGYGRYIKASNRAFTLFLNELRASQLNDLVNLGKADAAALGDDALSPLKNEVLAKEVAEFVNVATGRGKLKAQVPFFKKEYSMENAGAIKVMADIFFSPRLIASRLKMLNPSTYMYANPMVRKQYTKAILRSVGTWWGIASIAEMMFGAEVSKDPNNADYGKIKIGNTRLDPGGGFQQWLVLGSRMRPDAMKLPIESDTGITPVDLMTNLMGHGGGKYTSSSSGESFPFGEGYKPETRTSTMMNWLANKLHPTARFIWDLGSANEQVPVYVGDRMLQLFLPMMAGDLAELMMDDPELIPLVLPFSGLGGGSQTYTGEPGYPSITPAIDKMNPFGGPSLVENDLVLGRPRD